MFGKLSERQAVPRAETEAAGLRSFEDFLRWEAASRTVIDFKVVYVDLAGDLVAGLLLSQLIFWYLPGKDGETKLRIWKDDGWPWIAKTREQWYQEIRLSPKQLRAAERRLVELGILEIRTFRFNGLRTNHYRLRDEGRRLVSGLNSVVKPATESRTPGGSPGGDLLSPSVVPLGHHRSLPKGTTLNRDLGIDHCREVAPSRGSGATPPAFSLQGEEGERQRRVERRRKQLAAQAIQLGLQSEEVAGARER